MNEKINRTINWFTKENITVLLLMIVIFIAYYPVLHAGYVWDDETLTQNKILQSNLAFFKTWIQPSLLSNEYHYWPIVYTSFWLEHYIWGLSPLGFHLDNILLHILNSLLIGLILGKMHIPGAWLAALLFGIHPIHVESVAWVIERKDVLSTLFFLLSFLGYIHFDQTGKKRFYLCSLVLGVFAILSKSNTVILPIILLLYLWYTKSKMHKKDWVRLIPFFFISVGLALLDMFLSRQQNPYHSNLVFLQRCLMACHSIYFYAGKFLLPVRLITIYPKWPVDLYNLTEYFYLLLGLLILFFTWKSKKILGKGPIIALFFYVIALSPTLGLITFSFMEYSYVADRFQYLPSIGIISLSCAGVTLLHDRLQKANKIFLTSFISILIITLGTLTWIQCTYYQDTESLFLHTLKYNPSAWVAEYNVGVIQEQKGKVNDAITHYEKAIELKKDYAEAYNNLGFIRMNEGNYPQAYKLYQKSLQSNPSLSVAHNNMAILLVKLDKKEEAISHYLIAIQIKPNYAEAYNNLALLQVQLGKLDNAISNLTKAIEINPNYANAKYNLDLLITVKNATQQKQTQSTVTTR